MVAQWLDPGGGLLDAVVERLGEDRRFSASLGDQTYQVIERDYAIFPEKSGELYIPPVQFRGRVASGDPTARRRELLNRRATDTWPAMPRGKTRLGAKSTFGNVAYLPKISKEIAEK